MIEPVTAIWIGCGALAAIILAKMMRLRQLQLIELLKSYVEAQAAWRRRKERAIAIASAQEKNAKLRERSSAPSRDTNVSPATESPQKAAA